MSSAKGIHGGMMMVGLYILCSSCMLVINKASVMALPYSYTVTALQTGVSAVLLLVARACGIVSFQNPSMKIVRSWSGILAAWVLPILLNMNAVGLVTVETMMMFRSITVVAVAAGDALFLGSELKPRQIVACFIISVGGLLYSWNDQHYHLEGYTWGILYSASMVFNSLYVKHAFNQHNELNVWEKTYLNNMLGTPVVIMIAAWREDLWGGGVGRAMAGMPVSGSLAVAAGCVMGLGISMSGISCRSVLSATSFDVLGNCTKYLTLAVSAIFLGSTNSAASIGGIVIALTGCAVYSPAGGYVIGLILGQGTGGGAAKAKAS